jgi:hypothetical protein
MAISTGDLKEKIILKAPASSLNDRGEREITYPVDTLELFAAVERFNQYRTGEGNDTTLIGSLDFIIRDATNRDSLTKDWLLVYGGNDYTIHTVDRFFQTGFIRITAKAKSNG